MMRLGLCCIFREEPIKFRTTTVAAMKRLKERGGEPRDYLSEIIISNLMALEQAILYCHLHAIGCFRISSGLFPLFTHEEFSYSIQDFSNAQDIEAQLQLCRELAQQLHIRLSFHPDQFVVLNSPHPLVVQRSLQEMEYHALLAEKLGADVINLHAGGVYGNKTQALKNLGTHLAYLSDRALQRLTLENDDTSYSPEDLLPFCLKHGLPLVYDVHHHRCLPDQLSLEQATDAALKTWNREPLFHISSPREGWQSRFPKYHHDFIDIQDFPSYWKELSPLTIEVEAKAKEIAVLKLLKEIQEQ